MALAAVVVAMLALAVPALATFPGTNGPILFTRGPGPMSPVCSDDIWSMQPDGTGQTQVTNSPECESGPAVSPNGNLIAFARGNGRARERQEATWNTSCCDWAGQVFVAAEQVPNPYSDLPEGWPDWAPDGKSLVFNRRGFLQAVKYPFTPDSPTPSYWTHGEVGDDPAFSPRGDAIAFTKRGFDSNMFWFDIVVQDFSGTFQDLTPGTTSEYGASWSPDATKIAFTREPGDIWLMDADGTNQQQLTAGATDDNFPAWSPDGTKIAFVRCCFTGGTTELFTIDPDGSNVTQLTNDTTSEWDPNWKRATSGDPPGYPRPKGAADLTVSLVPAYAQCQAPSREHGPPMAFGSCAPPNRSSELLTVGTPDANAQPAKSSGSVTLTAVVGNPATQADEADVQIQAKLSDVRRADDLSDYGSFEILALVLELRRTDKFPTTPTGPPESTTGPDYTLRVSLPCAATPDPTEGARCTRSASSLDAIVPGFAPEGRRTTWQLQDLRLEDAGLDNDFETTADNRTFAVPGVFVP